MFKEAGVLAQIELTAYTGVAAFHIGFAAKTTCSSFQIFPNSYWNAELNGKAQWASVEFLIVDEISFIGRIPLARMRYRMNQAVCQFFFKSAKAASDHQFGYVSMVISGDFGRLDPIDDFSLFDNELPGARSCWQDKKHPTEGGDPVKLFREAIVLKRIHLSLDDKAWTESCRRLRNMTQDVIPELKRDYPR